VAEAAVAAGTGIGSAVLGTRGTAQRTGIILGLQRASGNHVMQRTLGMQRQVHHLPVSAPPPETASHHRISYAPGEVSASHNSPGGVTQRGQLEHVLFGFAVNEADLKPAHEQFIGQLVADHGLSGTTPLRQVERILGYSDLLGSEAVNQSLRLLRANAVAQAFVQLRVPGGLIGTIQAAPTGDLFMHNSTPDGRAANRGVLIRLSPLSAPAAPPLPDPASRPAFGNWNVDIAPWWLMPATAGTRSLLATWSIGSTGAAVHETWM